MMSVFLPGWVGQKRSFSTFAQNLGQKNRSSAQGVAVLIAKTMIPGSGKSPSWNTLSTGCKYLKSGREASFPARTQPIKSGLNFLILATFSIFEQKIEKMPFLDVFLIF